MELDMVHTVRPDEVEVIHKGVEYIIRQHPNHRIPIQLIFLFAGNGELECYILRELVALGYTIYRVWFVDIAYLRTVADLKQNLQTISGLRADEANIANGRTLLLRHNARKSRPDTTTITTDNFFKIANVNKSILFIESFELLHVLMEDYVKPNEPIGMIAIHPQGSGPNRQQIIGGFYKMYFTKYNQSFAILKRQEPYIHVLQPTTFQPLSAE
jgi:hypothetical protein